MQCQTRAIAQAINAQLIGDDALITGISIDTRTLKPGDLYIAIVGKQFDGHDFIAAAEQNGAAAVLVQREVATRLPQLRVNDTHRALAEMAGVWRNALPVKVAGVTGSNGKTTVKEMMAAIFAVAGTTLATQGNLNNDIGVPLTLLRLNDSHRYAVIEMGANHPGEIAYTSQYAKPDVVTITNVGAAHIEGFGSIEGVAKTKGELIQSLSADGVAVLNRDDAFYPFWLELANGRKTVSFGLSEAADVRGENARTTVVDGAFCSQFDLVTADERVPIELQLAGLHNVKNALAAATVCRQFGISWPQIQQGLAGLKPVTGRMQPLLGEMGNLIIDDSYNANPSSLQAALDVVATLGGERWLVLGAFGELGENSAEMHREMGDMIKASGITRLFAVGENTCYTVEQFGTGAQFFETQLALIDALKTALTGKETILIKGSRSQKMENVAAALVNNFRA